MSSAQSPAQWWRPASKREQMRLQRVLLRQVDRVNPESRLVVAVIALALIDAAHPQADIRRSAERFVRGADLALWCDLVGLEVDWVRELAERGGWLAAPSTPAAKEARDA